MEFYNRVFFVRASSNLVDLIAVAAWLEFRASSNLGDGSLFVFLRSPLKFWPTLFGQISLWFSSLSISYYDARSKSLDRMISWKDLLTAKGRSIVSADTSVIFPQQDCPGWNVDWNSIEKINVWNINSAILVISRNLFLGTLIVNIIKYSLKKRKYFEDRFNKFNLFSSFNISTLLHT